MVQGLQTCWRCDGHLGPLDGRGLSPHALRAMAATNRLERDDGIAKVQEWLC